MGEEFENKRGKLEATADIGIPFRFTKSQESFLPPEGKLLNFYGFLHNFIYLLIG
jgi:hypothetical protein